jgi:hypothetical protein
MSFLNGLLLLGGLAFVIPLIIHLLNRSKFQTVEWGAMHLLDNIELQNAKRIQWQAILLLLLRCAAPIVLALCMARPLWNMWTSGGRVGDAATTVLLVDDSYSMQASAMSNAQSSEKNFTNYDQMLTSARSLLDGVGGKSAKAVITLGGSPKNLTDGTSYDTKPIQRQIDQLQPASGPISPIAGLQLAIDTLNRSQEPYRQIALLSDFQRHDWEQIPEQSLVTIREELKKMKVPGQLHLFPFRSDFKENLFVAVDSLLSELTLIGEPVEIRATVTNSGEQNATQIPITLSIDDKEISAKKLDIPAKGEVQVTFVVTLDQPGTHQANMRIKDPGTMQADDADVLRIDAVQPLEVLLVEDDINKPLLESETGFLQAALQSTFRDDEKSIGLTLDRQPTARLTPAMIEKCDVVVLANIGRLNDECVAALRKRVEDGASLWVFPGDRIDKEWYRTKFGTASEKPLLTLNFDELKQINSTAKPEANSEPVPRIAAGPYYDPALSLFNNPQQGRLDQVAVKGWFKLVAAGEKASEKEKSVPPGESLLKLTNNDPLLVRQQVGKGTVYQWATRANDSWSELPIRPAYVPLVQRLVLFSHGTFEPHRTTELRRESKNDPMSDDELKKLAASLGASVHDSTSSFLKQDTDQRYGREMWRWFLVGLLVVLFGELFVEKRITRGGE